jgi:hypothetical protein
MSKVVAGIVCAIGVALLIPLLIPREKTELTLSFPDLKTDSLEAGAGSEYCLNPDIRVSVDRFLVGHYRKVMINQLAGHTNILVYHGLADGFWYEARAKLVNCGMNQTITEVRVIDPRTIRVMMGREIAAVAMLSIVLAIVIGVVVGLLIWNLKK